MNSKTMREVLTETYQDFINNYLTVEVYAEHNGLTAEQGMRLLVLAREIYNSDHPEK